MAPQRHSSKRLTTRHRAKVERKLREHRRKLNKQSNSKVHKKPRKDPGIPTMLPGKEEFIQRMQEEREKEKMQRKALISRNDLTSLAEQATTRAMSHSAQHQEETGNNEGEKGRFFDSSKRAFYREFRQVVEGSDVILVVLDARDPLGCRVRVVEEMVANSGGRKRIVMVLNKIDLVPREIVSQWLVHLRREFPTIAFKASTQTQRSNLGSISVSREKMDSALSSSECLGADTLVQLLKNYCRSLNIKTSISVGVVGYPNVGKSSLINSLKRAKVCKVGAAPGVTTASQEIHLDKNIKLLDCPGIVFATPSTDNRESAKLFLRNCLKVEQLEDPTMPVELILQRAPTEQFMMLYSIPRFEGVQQFLCSIAKHQGKLRKGGIPNLEEAAKSVLNDWNQGKIPFYTLPPTVSSSSPTTPDSETVIVSNWAPEFDFDNISRVEVDTVLSNIAERLPCAQPIIMEDADKIPNLVVTPIASKKGHTAAKDDYTFELTAGEIENNPQINRSRQKSIKQAKKLAQKRTNRVVLPLGASDMVPPAPDNDMQVDDDAYNFSTDFYKATEQ